MWSIKKKRKEGADGVTQMTGSFTTCGDGGYAWSQDGRWCVQTGLLPSSAHWLLGRAQREELQFCVKALGYFC